MKPAFSPDKARKQKGQIYFRAIGEGLDVASACYRVGYESPSQFSREYSRQFGCPPSQDVKRLRGSG